ALHDGDEILVLVAAQLLQEIGTLLTDENAVAVEHDTGRLDAGRKILAESAGENARRRPDRLAEIEDDEIELVAARTRFAHIVGGIADHQLGARIIIIAVDAEIFF